MKTIRSVGLLWLSVLAIVVYAGHGIGVRGQRVTAGPPLEPVCQGANALFCDDFETGDYRRWGHPPLFDTDPPTRLVVSRERPLLGQHSLRFVYNEYQAPSYQSLEFPPGVTEIRVRFYVYLDALYHFGFGPGAGIDHTFTIASSGGTKCTGSPGSFDFGGTNATIYRPGTESCMNRVDLALNMGTAEDRMIRNGAWHRLEYHLKLNSIGGCVDKNRNGFFDALGECDGVYELWYNGKPVMGYYDVNMRGSDSGYQIGGFLFNHYYRTNGQAFNGKTFAEYRDNLVVLSGSNGGQVIGPAPDAPPVVTFDRQSPYQTQVYKEWFAFSAEGAMTRPGGDCGPSQFAGNGPHAWYNNSSPSNFSFVSSPARNQVRAPCPIPAGSDKAVSVTTQSGHAYGGGGIDGSTGVLPNGTHVINGWMYLDPASFPAANGVVLSGLIRYASGGRNYIAMGLDAANHPQLLQQTKVESGQAPLVLAQNPAMTVSTGRWHQFEFRANERGDVSALLDGVQAVSAAMVNVADIFRTEWGYHYGISDHLNNPRTLVSYFDEISIGNTSFQDCFGWAPGICPFAEPIRPAPPTNVRISR